MLYHFLAPLGREYILFNLFTYISFRAAGAVVTALLIAFVVGPMMIRTLAALKVGQVVRTGLLATHDGKRGTPTMGGLIIVVATVVPTLLWAQLSNEFVVVALLALLWNCGIGFLDDYLKVVRGKPRGLVARWKLVGQCSFGLALGVFLWLHPIVPLATLPATASVLPFLKYTIIIFVPAAYVAFVTFVVTGSSNAVNMTDGLDGLATGLTAIAAAGFAFFAYILGRVDMTSYLNFYYLPGAGELAIVCAALMGGALGFLWFNAHPAQVFMGDTGALAIGGALGTVAILLRAEFLLVIIGGVFVAEQLSVIIQVGVYQWFKRTRGREYADAHRVFRMAPLHHHFEKKGWTEPQVVVRFWIAGILCALLAIATLKVR
jgi:phospho-N-acetylmuramoyl-pentapeptide-transferase